MNFEYLKQFMCQICCGLGPYYTLRLKSLNAENIKCQVAPNLTQNRYSLFNLTRNNDDVYNS